MNLLRFKFLAPALFLAAVLAISVFAFNYKSCFTTNREAASHWPSHAKLARSEQLPTLIVFLHPHCINSAVTLTELEKILPSLKGKAQVFLSFYAPSNHEETWVRRSPWRQAEKMHNVNIYADINGEDSAKFGAQSSGEIFLYDTSGDLVFHGGLNRELGFAGPRPGVSALLAWLGSAPQDDAPRETAVWGRNLRSQISISLLDLK